MTTGNDRSKLYLAGGSVAAFVAFLLGLYAAGRYHQAERWWQHQPIVSRHPGLR